MTECMHLEEWSIEQHQENPSPGTVTTWYEWTCGQCAADLWAEPDGSMSFADGVKINFSGEGDVLMSMMRAFAEAGIRFDWEGMDGIPDPFTES